MKRADISSIETGLDSTHEAERLGVTPETPAHTLFFVDAKGLADEKRFVAAREKWKLGELTVDRILKPSSAITVPPTRRRAAPSQGRISRAAAKKANSQPLVKKSVTVYDLWTKELSPEEQPFNEGVMKSSRSTMPCFSAILPPDACESYHPDPQKHLARLKELEARELARQSSVAALATNATADNGEEDMVERANQELLNPVAVDDDDDTEFAHNVERQRKKTKAQRNRELRQRQARQAALDAKKKKAMLAQLQDSESLAKHVSLLQTALQKRATASAVAAVPTKKTGKRRITPAPLAIKLPDEQPRSLRLLAPEGNLVSDRFRSFAKRAMIEPTAGLISSTDRARARKRQRGTFRSYLKMSHRV